jgi:hypothetical protein
MDLERQYLDASAPMKGAFSGGMIQAAANAQNAYAPQTAAPTLADRLQALLQLAHGSGAALSNARERLCGGWPENAGQNGIKPAPGQIDSLLDELQAALIRISDHAQVLNARI